MIRRRFWPLGMAMIAFCTQLLLPACGGDEDSTDPSAACGSPNPSEDQAPEDLACTGLYADVSTKTLAPSSRPYAPAVAFWSDGLDKDRFIQLPDGMTIDASNIDEWKFPIGTKAWKEIRQGARKIETRFFW